MDCSSVKESKWSQVELSVTIQDHFAPVARVELKVESATKPIFKDLINYRFEIDDKTSNVRLFISKKSDEVKEIKIPSGNKHQWSDKEMIVDITTLSKVAGEYPEIRLVDVTAQQSIRYKRTID